MLIFLSAVSSPYLCFLCPFPRGGAFQSGHFRQTSGRRREVISSAFITKLAGFTRARTLPHWWIGSCRESADAQLAKIWSFLRSLAQSAGGRVSQVGVRRSPANRPGREQCGSEPGLLAGDTIGLEVMFTFIKSPLITTQDKLYVN